MLQQNQKEEEIHLKGPTFDDQLSQNYNILEKLGEGTYGKVHKALDIRNQSYVAIKYIKLEQDDEGVPSTTLREISILKELSNHRNIVKIKEIVYAPLEKKLCLVFEYIPQDLSKYIKMHVRQDEYADPQRKQLIREKHIPEDTVKYIMYQLFLGVDFCHKRRILHRDIKPQNILISNTSHVKIADFGLARAFTLPIKTLTHEVETLWYRAPEVLLGSKYYSIGLDSWSLGCILYELYYRRPLFQGDSEIDQIFKIFQFFGTPDDSTWPGVTQLKDYKKTFPKFKYKPDYQWSKIGKMSKSAQDLLQGLIKLDPCQRISARTALKHEYFQNMSPELQDRISRLQKDED